MTQKMDSFDLLPDEILAMIFSNLPLKYRRRVALTCIRFYNIVTDFYVWGEIVLETSYKRMTKELRNFLIKIQPNKIVWQSYSDCPGEFRPTQQTKWMAAITNLQTLELKDVEDPLLVVTKLTSLQSLNLDSCQQSDGWAGLTNLTGLRHLNLDKTGLVCEDLLQLSVLQHLKSLSIQSLHGRIAFEDLFFVLSKFHDLSSLDISRTIQVDHHDSPLQNFQLLTGLESFHMSYSPMIRKNLARALMALPLTELDVQGTGFHDDALEDVIFTELKSLNLNNTPSYLNPKSFPVLETLHCANERFAVNNLRMIRGLTTLKVLELSVIRPYYSGGSAPFGVVQFTEEEMEHLSPLKELKKLTVSSSMLNVSGWVSHFPKLVLLNVPACRAIICEHLAQVTTLKSLNVSHCPLTNEGIVMLSSLTRLTSLRMERCGNINGKGMKHLTTLVNLRELVLTHCSIGEKGVSHFTAFMRLNFLDLTKCEKIPNASISSLSCLTNLTRLNLSHYCITSNGMKVARPPPEKLLKNFLFMK